RGGLRVGLGGIELLAHRFESRLLLVLCRDKIDLLRSALTSKRGAGERDDDEDARRCHAGDRHVRRAKSNILGKTFHQQMKNFLRTPIQRSALAVAVAAQCGACRGDDRLRLNRPQVASPVDEQRRRFLYSATDTALKILADSPAMLLRRTAAFKLVNLQTQRERDV